MVEMNKEIVSKRQYSSSIILYIFGSSLIMGVSNNMGQDGWIALIISGILFFPVLLIYIRLTAMHPEKDIFDIAYTLFGKIWGRMIAFIFVLFSLHLGALVVRNFSEFMESVMMPETPQLPMMMLMVLVSSYLASSGFEVFGRWSSFILPIVIAVIIFTLIFSCSNMDFSNLKPIMGNSLPALFKSSFITLSFPLGDMVVFLGVLCARNKNDNPYKLFITAFLVGILFLVSTTIRNLMILGPNVVKDTYYPSFIASRTIYVGSFFTRIESTIAGNLMFAGITKISVCLLVSAKGVAKFLSLKSYKSMVVPLGLSVLALSYIAFDRMDEMFEYGCIYYNYSLYIQILLPAIIWIAAEIKLKKQKKANR
jgi:spore germination protein KB